MKRALLILILGFITAVPVFAQLKELESVPMEVPSNIIQGNSRFPDNALVMVYSSLSDLQFRSSMGGINLVRYDPVDHVHLILLTPVKQILSVTAPGYIELQIQTINPAPKVTLAFKVEERTFDPLAEMGILSVASDPPGAEIWVNNIQTVYRTPAQLPLPAGQAYIGLRADRHQAFDTLVRMGKKEEIRIDASLTGLWADLLVHVEPAEAIMTLSRDGSVLYSSIGSREWKGRSEGLDKGSYTLTVGLDGHRDDIREIRLQPGDRRVMDVRLQQVTGSLVVRSTPSGAEVWLDGRSLGKTPYTGEVRPGRGELAVRLAGHRESVRYVEVSDGRTEVVDVSLDRRLTARLNVTSEPSGAAVHLDGDFIGETPFEGEVDVTDRKSRGNRRILVKLADYESQDATVNLQPSDRPVRASFQMKRKMGRYRISSSPAGADIFANSVSLGKAPVAGDLPTGTYQITAVKPKYSAEPERIEIRENRTTQLDLTLRKTERHPTDRFYLYFGVAGFDLLKDPGPIPNSSVGSDELAGGGGGADVHACFMSGRNFGVVTGLTWSTNFKSTEVDATYYDRYALYIGPQLSFPLSRTVKMELLYAVGISGMDLNPAVGSVYESVPVRFRLSDDTPPIHSLAREDRFAIQFRFGTVLPFVLGAQFQRVNHQFPSIDVARGLSLFSLNAGFAIAIPRKND